MMKNKLKIKLTELFMAKADWKRCHYGTITRSIDSNNQPLVRGKITMSDGKYNAVILSQAENTDKLGEMLDEMVVMVLDKGLHSPIGISTSIFGNRVYFN